MDRDRPIDATPSEEETMAESGSGCSSDDEDDCESSGQGQSLNYALSTEDRDIQQFWILCFH